MRFGYRNSFPWSFRLHARLSSHKCSQGPSPMVHAVAMFSLTAIKLVLVDCLQFFRTGYKNQLWRSYRKIGSHLNRPKVPFTWMERSANYPPFCFRFYRDCLRAKIFQQAGFFMRLGAKRKFKTIVCWAQQIAIFWEIFMRNIGFLIYVWKIYDAFNIRSLSKITLTRSGIIVHPTCGVRNRDTIIFT